MEVGQVSDLPSLAAASAIDLVKLPDTALFNLSAVG